MRRGSRENNAPSTALPASAAPCDVLLSTPRSGLFRRLVSRAFFSRVGRVMGIVLVGFLAGFWTTTSWGIPLSERIFGSEEAMMKGVARASRDPFRPGGDASGLFDAQSLSIQGLIAHPRRKGMVLMSGFMAWEGDKIGKYEIAEVDPGRVVLRWGRDNQMIKTIPGYLKSRRAKQRGYSVAFRDAPIKKVAQMISRLEDKNVLYPPSLSGRVTVSFDHINPMSALRSILKVHDYTMAVENAIVRIGKPDQFEEGVDLQTTTVAMNYGSAEDLAKKVKEILSPQGSVIADVRTNTLAIRDRPHILTNIRSLLKGIDYRDKRVRIAAKILSATNEFTRSLGIQWGVTKTVDNVTVSGADSVGTSTSSSNPFNVDVGAASPAGGIGLLIGSITGNNLEAILTAAQEKGTVDIISRPTITTLNNQAAKIRSGLKIYVKSTSDITLGAPAGSATGGASDLEQIETGVTLSVTPQITEKSYLKLKIELEESTADFSRTVDGIPAILDNTASTNVLLASGETTIIGGLFRTQRSKEKTGVPILSNIPVLGLFFSRTTKSKEDRELLIFITPEIIEDDFGLSSASQSVKSK